MSKFIGLILLAVVVLLVPIIGKIAPGSPASSRPSERTAPRTNIQYSAPGGGTATSDSSKSETASFSKKIDISSAGVSGYPKEYSRITLYSRLQEKEAVNITGWKIKSNKNEIVIPQGVEIYDPSGSLPTADIVLKSGHYVDLYSLASPLNRNLRLNKCVGYLENIYDFKPLYISQNCPYFSSSEIKQLSGQCQSYISSLSACKTPDVGFYNNLPGTDEGNACRAFLQNIGYGGCFRDHRQDADFLSKNWIIWLEPQTFNLDPQHDYLRLYDRKGNLVSEYSY